VQPPAECHGRRAKDIDGVSFRSVLDDASAPSTRFEQYSEARGNRGFYRDGWKLLTLHGPGTPYAEQEWQLFDVRTDPTETTNVAEDFPDKVRELAAAWETAAWANTVFPLPDRTPRRHRPEDDEMSQPVRLLPGTPTLERHRSSRLTALRSFDVAIELEHAASDAGVLVAHGDQGGGYSVYIESGRLWLAYNEYGELKEVDCGPLLAGPRVIRLAAQALPDFRWDLHVAIDGVDVGRLDGVAMLLGLAPFEGIDVGIDRRSPVHWGMYERHGAFPYGGRLRAVTYTPGERPDYDAQLLAQATRESTRIYE
jgi:arylsulfatase